MLAAGCSSGDAVVVLPRPPSNSGTWDTLAPFTQARTENSAVEVGGFLYVIGGFLSVSVPALDVERSLIIDELEVTGTPQDNLDRVCG